MPNTIGTLAVAFFAANAATLPPVATRTSIGRVSSSVANAAKRSLWLSAQRYSIAQVVPSVYPVSPKPL